MEFLKLVMVNRARQLGDGTWETPGAEGVKEAVGTHIARIYIEQRQANVAQWVALRPLFYVCAREAGNERVFQRRKVWGRQEATEKQLQATLADSQEAKRRRRIGGDMGMH